MLYLNAHIMKARKLLCILGFFVFFKKNHHSKWEYKNKKDLEVK